MHRHPFAAAALLYVLFIMVAGCASIPAADTFNKKAAAATVSVNAASETVLTLLQARKITPDEADAFTDRAEELQQAIDFARSIQSTNPTAAEDRLAAAIAALSLLTAELEGRK